MADITVRSDYVYLANFGGADNFLIMQFTSDLQFVAGYGTKVPANTTNNAQGQFYGPHLFVGLRSQGFVILDPTFP